MSADSIRYLQRSQINTVKWDHCIANASNGLIYSYSFSLDHMAENWDALVLGDYEMVMPLPWKKKWGVKYVYTPLFMQRLGICGNHVDASHEQMFYQLACRHFSFIDLMAPVPASGRFWSARPRNNFVIPLGRPYTAIARHYSEECAKNIRKAVSRKCVFAENLSIDRIISMYRQAYGGYSSHMNNDVLGRLSGWAGEAAARGMLKPWGVINAESHQLLFGALLFQCNKRLYYLAGAPSEAGRQARATYYFIDQVLQRYAGHPLLFDFEGSDIPNVAAFYKRFGPQPETYYHLLYNGLPWWIKWLKKGS